MSRAAQECKGNNAVTVKGTAPRPRPLPPIATLFYRGSMLIFPIAWRKKKLDNQSICDIIVFTDSALGNADA